MTKDRSFSTAIQIMTTLGFHPEASYTSKILANGCQTNPGLIRRIMSKLASASLIETQKGKNGGAKIAKAPSSITLYDIYTAINDDLLFQTFEKEPLAACEVSCQIGHILTNVYEDLEKHLDIRLKEITLDSLIGEIK